MVDTDGVHWDERYRARTTPVAGPPEVFAHYVDVFPSTGHALDLACGAGAASVWLAGRGLTVVGVDASAVAVAQARELAERIGVATRCRFEVRDLDEGLPPGEAADVIVCHRYRDPRLYSAIVGRLAPGGLLAISVLSEVGAEPGRYRAGAGELAGAFADLQTVACGEGDGQAWLLARAGE
ncbi:class I SAM-dependent methyltransferase [Mycolicibacterium sp. CBM1]